MSASSLPGGIKPEAVSAATTLPVIIKQVYIPCMYIPTPVECIYNGVSEYICENYTVLLAIFIVYTLHAFILCTCT